jgi:hypothetical protein
MSNNTAINRTCRFTALPPVRRHFRAQWD